MIDKVIDFILKHFEMLWKQNIVVYAMIGIIIFFIYYILVFVL